MRQCRATGRRGISASFEGCLGLFFAGLVSLSCATLNGQSTAEDSLAKQVQVLTESMARTQAQLEQSQHELQQMRDELAALQQKMAERDVAAASSGAAQLSSAVDEIREQQSLQEAQIATHEQSKVESESKYPVKLSGLVLLNGFVNTRQVDVPATPTVALPGSGSTGATLKQTILGIDVRGPHLFSASSHADVRVDFDGSAASDNQGAGAYAAGLVRLRTAHAELQWEKTEAFFSLDHSIISANSPSSLTAVSVPALAWSGNLWSWLPQIGIAHDFGSSSAPHMMAEAALIDVANPPLPYTLTTTAATGANAASPSSAEQSRWPGVESRIALVGRYRETGLQIGAGGLFVPHRTAGGIDFDSWAAALDYRIPFPKGLELSGNVYRGAALGGLGGGAYKDYLYYVNPNYPEMVSFRALDDVGGWGQLKAHSGDHLEFNFAFGTDQVPATQLRPYTADVTGMYFDLARNRTFTSNVIYSPSAYLQFSLEYRRLESSPVSGATAAADIIGIATGYRF